MIFFTKRYSVSQLLETLGMPQPGWRKALFDRDLHLAHAYKFLDGMPKTFASLATISTDTGPSFNSQANTVLWLGRAGVDAPVRPLMATAQRKGYTPGVFLD
jgi:hypothetical protein